jgi:hypothetical protein
MPLGETRQGFEAIAGADKSVKIIVEADREENN